MGYKPQVAILSSWNTARQTNKQIIWWFWFVCNIRSTSTFCSIEFWILIVKQILWKANSMGVLLHFVNYMMFSFVEDKSVFHPLSLLPITIISCLFRYVIPQRLVSFYHKSSSSSSKILNITTSLSILLQWKILLRMGLFLFFYHFVIVK